VHSILISPRWAQHAVRITSDISMTPLQHVTCV
jgi:hypothetical protein